MKHYQIKYPELNSEYPERARQFQAQNQIQPLYTTAQIKRFIERLISSEKNVVEIWNQNEKLMAGLLIDLITNPHESAHIEYLGFAKDYQVTFEPLKLLLETFEQRVKEQNKFKGIIIGHHSSLPFSENYLNDLDYRFYYQSYELQLANKEKNIFNTSAEKPLALGQDHYPEYYRLVCECFKENPDTSVGTYEDMYQGFITAEIPTYAIFIDSQMAGFINVSLDSNSKSGEIHTLGVLPQFRRQGIGKKLLQFGIEILKHKGAQNIVLTVGAENQRALLLYFEAGFEIKDQHAVFRKSISL